MKPAGRNKGQVLVIALGVVLAFFFLSIVVVETGYFLYQKIHLQNTADSLAMETGIQYARCLNLASMINKVRYCTSFLSNAAQGLVGFLMDTCRDAICDSLPPVLKETCKGGFDLVKDAAKKLVKEIIDDLVIPELGAADKTVASIQRAFSKWVPFTAVVGNWGKTVIQRWLDEKMFCLPCFWKGYYPGVFPSLAMYTDEERDEEEIEYTYDDPAKGSTTVEEDDVEFDPKARKWRQSSGNKYYVDRKVKIKGDTQKDIDAKTADMKKMIDDAEKEAAKEAVDSLISSQTYIEETGPQEIMVVCVKAYEPLLLKKWVPKKMALWSFSKVVIEGGSMQVSDLGEPENGGGAQYFPKIVNVGIYKTAGKIEDVLYMINNLKNEFNIHNDVLDSILSFLTEVAGTSAKVYH